MVVKNVRLIPAVGYLRRSDDKQVASIDDQRTAVLAYAAQHGYQIIRWYIDDDISGDDTENREEFKRMRGDAQDRRDFQAILCWNQDRFGRFDQLEAGYWIHPLRKAGVYLVTCDMGRIDWDSPEGQLIYGVNQMGKHKFLKDLSRNVVRGQLEAARKGSWIGSHPYGYRIEGSRKNKRIVLDDPVKVAIVRRIFDEYVHQGRSLNEIARRLNADGVVPPGGPAFRWRYDSVKYLLSNHAYVGDYRAYGNSYGKYSQVHAQQIVKGGKRQRNPEEDWILIQGAETVEVIIDRDTFDQAQALIAKGRTGRSKYNPEENPYLFSGLLRCAKCGGAMHGKRNRGIQCYECWTNHYRGADVCEGSTVREDVLLLELGEFLMDWLGIPSGLGDAAYYDALKVEDVPEAFWKVHKLIVPPPRPEKERKQLAREHKQLTNQLALARANLVLLEPENIPAAQATIRQLDARCQEIDKELAESKPPAQEDINRLVLSTIHSLSSLAIGCLWLAKQKKNPQWHYHNSEMDAAPENIRRFFGHGYHIRLHTQRSGRGRGVRHRFMKGELVFQPIGKGSGKVVGVNTRESNPSLQLEGLAS